MYVYRPTHYNRQLLKHFLFKLKTFETSREMNKRFSMKRLH